MLSEKLLHEMNEQVKHEMFSANYYLSMAAYFNDKDLPGFANFFRIQAQEENMHAMKFFDFIDEVNGRVRISALDEPQSDFESVKDVIKLALEHEQFVTKKIHQLMDIAVEEKNYPAISFLNWFVDEQVEEEATMQELLSKILRVGDKGHVLYLLDKEMGSRQPE
ncbi:MULTISPECIES: ferritin [Tindallia]|uniref:Ferritin n=2 Tax=Tindallia TaxID=69894 RepID=A0A1H3JX72_9FIRM|nr:MULTISPECIES: ferritin [Tindallia]SDY44209.1 ferritin [Tindallia californiensis]SFI14082.1 ferritin [Tindallia magadiensis]